MMAVLSVCFSWPLDVEGLSLARQRLQRQKHNHVPWQAVRISIILKASY